MTIAQQLSLIWRRFSPLEERLIAAVRAVLPPQAQAIMKARFTYWQESDGRFLAYLNDYPDHWTQGESLDDLKEHLRDLFHTFRSEQIPGIRKVEELEIA